MLDPAEYDDIEVTITHPWGELTPTLTEWIFTGPGPRPLLRIRKARRRSTGERVPLSEIPLEYHNSPEARALQRRGQLRIVWDPPPADEPDPPEIPPHIRAQMNDEW
jgi:hypothetical protein